MLELLDLNIFPAVEAGNLTRESRIAAYSAYIKDVVEKVNEAIKVDSALGNTFTTVRVEYTPIRGMSMSPVDVLNNAYEEEDYDVDIQLVMRNGIRYMEIQLDWTTYL